MHIFQVTRRSTDIFFWVMEARVKGGWWPVFSEFSLVAHCGTEKDTCLSLLQMANRKVVIEEVLTERENYSKVILHKPMMLPKKDQKSEKEIDIRDTSRYVIISQWWKITQKSLILQFYERSELLYLQRENSRN